MQSNICVCSTPKHTDLKHYTVFHLSRRVQVLILHCSLDLLLLTEPRWAFIKK